MITDQELLELFDRSQLPQERWTHQAHLRVALLYLRRLGPQQALEELRDKIQRLNLFHGVYTTRDRGYHETRTRVWLSVLWDGSKSRSDEDLIGEYSQKDVCLDYYQRSTLATWESRIGWVPPDKKSLPVDPGPWCPETPELITYPEG